MKSKVLALVLACLMTLSVPVFAATYPDVPETHDRYEAISMLSSMDIITGFPDGSFKPDEAVTRAQMAALITRMFSLGSFAVTEEPFSDVAVDYWAASDIVAAKKRGIINGFPDGTFQPDAQVTYEQAVKMIVCALNYGTAAEKLGGYPGGYITQASKLNILNKAAFAQTQPAPRGIIAQLLYNSLDVDMLVAQVKPDGTINYVKSEDGNNSVSQQFLKSYTVKGATVVRTPRVNMEPGVSAIASVNDNALFIKTTQGDYIKLIAGANADAFGYVGQVVDVTYKEEAGTDDKTLTSIKRSNSVEVTENIKLSDVISLTNNELTYYTDKANDFTKTINFNATPTVIYNERLHTGGIAAINADLFSVSNHEYASGVISVYNGNTTLVKAKSYKIYVVDSIDSRNEVIKVKGAVIGGTPQSNKDISIPYKDAYINETVIRKGNFNYSTGAVAANATKLSSYSGISKGHIIAVASNTEDTSNSYFEVLVSSTTVNGTVNEYATDDATGRPVIKVGTSSAMLLARELDRYEQTDKVHADVNAKFHIDPFGEIGYISDIKTSDVRLAIPVSATKGGSGFDRVTQVQLYNVANGALDTLFFRNESDSEILKDGSGALITDSIFKYTVKSGKIDTIELLQAGSDDYTYVAEKSAVSEVSDITKVSNSKITFAGGKDITYNSSSTKIIMIGSSASSETVTPKTATMTTNTAYTGKVYQMNNENSAGYRMQYVIIRPFEGLTDKSPTYIVESIGSNIPTENGNIVTIKVYNFTGTSKSGNGAEATELTITEEVQSTLRLKKGDVFTYYTLPGDGVADIGTLRNVYILARADEIAAGTYPSTGYMTADDNAQAATGGYNRDYRFWGIQSQQSTLVGPNALNVFAYYMGIPMDYIISEDGTEHSLTIAKDSVTKLPVLPGDTADIATMEAKVGDGSYFYDYNVTSLANIFVYEADGTLVQVKGKDNVQSYLAELNTVRNNIPNTTNKSHDTLFVKAYNTDSSNIALYNLYIIKDARVNP